MSDVKVYTQADFDALQRDEKGYLHCASGDWSQVNFAGAKRIVFEAGCTLGDWCMLGDWCTLGDRCTLGYRCTLGDGCTLGERCTLGDWCMLGYRCKLGNGCTLGDWCTLGDRCTLGYRCKLGDECTLGNRCTLGDGCKLGTGCTLGDGCTLGNRCVMEGGRVQNAAFFKVSNIGSRNDSLYCYCDTQTGERYYRAGCWFSSEADFIRRVQDVHAGTIYETDYLSAVKFAKARFGLYSDH